MPILGDPLPPSLKENEMEQAVAKQTSNREFSMVPRTIAESIEYATVLSKSNLVPKGFQGNAPDILLAMQMGMELGFSPIQSLQSICVINGRPSIWGDGVVALLLGSGECEYISDPEYTGDGNSRSCTVRVKRRGRPESVGVFTIEMAKKADLLGKSTWKNYTDRMLFWRAFSWPARKDFADVLKGIQVREEMQDYVDVTPEPQKAIAMPQRKSEADATMTIEEIPICPDCNWVQDECKCPPTVGEGNHPESEPSVPEKKAGSATPDLPLISTKQNGRLYALTKAEGLNGEDMQRWVYVVYGFEHTTDITKEKYESVCEGIMKGRLKEFLEADNA